jgi:hypothetical protein
MNRVCKTCGIEKDLSEFPTGSGYKDGHRPNCIECRRGYERRSFHEHKHKHPYSYEADKNRKLLRTYGIGYEDYLTMLDEQNGVCAICGTSDTGRRKSFHVDHCHISGKVRGILCGNCNSGIGHLRDDIRLLHSAIDYLSKYKDL